MELDDLQDAILDWQRHYPNDPWLPHTFARLLNNYQRAGGTSTQRARASFTGMQSTCPDSEETARIVAMGYAAPAPAPIAAPVASTNVWVRFDRSRGNVGQSTRPPRESLASSHHVS